MSSEGVGDDHPIQPFVAIDDTFKECLAIGKKLKVFKWLISEFSSCQSTIFYLGNLGVLFFHITRIYIIHV